MSPPPPVFEAGRLERPPPTVGGDGRGERAAHEPQRDRQRARRKVGRGSRCTAGRVTHVEPAALGKRPWMNGPGPPRRTAAAAPAAAGDAGGFGGVAAAEFRNLDPDALAPVLLWPRARCSAGRSTGRAAPGPGRAATSRRPCGATASG